MNRYRFVFVGLLFFLVISTNISVLAVDQSFVGVKEGEEYTFIMEKYYALREQPDRDTRSETIDYLYGDEGTIALEDGDHFTYRIINSTTYNRNEESIMYDDGTVRSVYYIFPYSVDVEIVGPNGTVVNSQLGIGFGSILSDTNWTGYKIAVEEYIDEIDKISIWNPDIIYTSEIIDTNTEFGYKVGQVFSGNDTSSNTNSNHIDVRYEKSTGMANLLSIEHINTQKIDNITYSLESATILRRIGYSSNNEETALISGFTMYLSFTALLILIYQQKKHIS